MDCSPPGSCVLGFSSKNTGMGCPAPSRGSSRPGTDNSSPAPPALAPPGPRFPSRPNLRVGTPVPVPLSWVDAGFPGEGVGFRVCSFPERVVQGWLAWRILQRVPVALLTHTPQQDLGQLPGYCLGTQRSRGAAVNLFGIIHSFICSSSKYFSAITLSSLFEDSLKIFTPMMKILQLMTKKNKIWYTKILETFKKQITWCPSNAALLPLYSGTLNMFWTWNF